MHASTTSTPLRSRLTFIGVTAAAGAVLAVGLTASPASAASGEYTGTLADGTAWRAVVPDDWNGTLLLYSHGYQPSFAGPRAPATVAPNPATEQLLLEQGYALVGSTYEATGWAVPTAPGRPARVIGCGSGSDRRAAGSCPRVRNIDGRPGHGAPRRVGGRRDRGRDADLRSDGGRRRPEQLPARRLACDRRTPRPRPGHPDRGVCEPRRCLRNRGRAQRSGGCRAVHRRGSRARRARSGAVPPSGDGHPRRRPSGRSRCTPC